jgi:hypothetical protein
MPILSFVMPTPEFVFSGGEGLVSSVEGGFPSSFVIPISSLAMPNDGFPFGWNIHSGSGTTPIHIGVHGRPNIPWGSTPNRTSSNPFRYPSISGGTSPGGSFSLRGSHHLGYTHVPRGIPPRGSYGPRNGNPFGSTYVLEGSYGPGNGNPFRSTYVPRGHP